jgi:hypothetical protein
MSHFDLYFCTSILHNINPCNQQSIILCIFHDLCTTELDQDCLVNRQEFKIDLLARGRLARAFSVNWLPAHQTFGKRAARLYLGATDASCELSGNGNDRWREKRLQNLSRARVESENATYRKRNCNLPWVMARLFQSNLDLHRT